MSARKVRGIGRRALFQRRIVVVFRKQRCRNLFWKGCIQRRFSESFPKFLLPIVEIRVDQFRVDMVPDMKVPVSIDPRRSFRLETLEISRRKAPLEGIDV